MRRAIQETMRRAAGMLLIGALVGCGGHEASQVAEVAEIADGAVGGLCYANHTCNDGLVCNAEGTCVVEATVTDGTAGGPCYGNDTCNHGLICGADGICVVADALSDDDEADPLGQEKEDAAKTDDDPTDTSANAVAPLICNGLVRDLTHFPNCLAQWQRLHEELPQNAGGLAGLMGGLFMGVFSQALCAADLNDTQCRR